MNINEFARLVTLKEQGKKEVNIAQVKEIIKIIKDQIKKTGVDIYSLIRYL